MLDTKAYVELGQLSLVGLLLSQLPLLIAWMLPRFQLMITEQISVLALKSCVYPLSNQQFSSVLLEIWPKIAWTLLFYCHH